jgi:hypothetical protein
MNFCLLLQQYNNSSSYGTTGDSAAIMLESHMAAVEEAIPSVLPQVLEATSSSSLPLQPLLSGFAETSSKRGNENRTEPVTTNAQSTAPLQVMIDGQATTLNGIDVELDVQRRCRHCQTHACSLKHRVCPKLPGKKKKCSGCGGVGHNVRGCNTRSKRSANIVSTYKPLRSMFYDPRAQACIRIAQENSTSFWVENTFRNASARESFLHIRNLYPDVPISRWKKRHSYYVNRCRYRLRNGRKCGLPQVIAMWFDQGGVCPICSVDTPLLDLSPREGRSGRWRFSAHVDHNHDTGVVRGLLCAFHNTMLGLARENRGALARGVAYLHERGHYERPRSRSSM